MSDNDGNDNAGTNNTAGGSGGPGIAPALHPAGDTAALATVGLKFPPFFRGNPEAWFRMLDAQFSLRNITSEVTRFNHLICQLPEDVASVLLTADTQPSYTEMKAAVLQMLQKSQQDKINELLDVADLGGDKPSVFIKRLNAKMSQCGLHQNPDMIKATLLRCLPPELRVQLSGFQDQSPEHLASIADSMLAIHQSSGARIGAVQKEFPTRYQSQSSSVAPFRPGQRPVICRAHLYYGARARTCRRWCQFPRQQGSHQPRLLGPNERTPLQSRSNSPERQHPLN